MKKVLILIFLTTNSILFADTLSNFIYGFSTGNIGFNNSAEESEAWADIGSIRFLELNTGLGLTTYILPLSITDDDVEIDHDLFSLELNWEPFFNPGDFWGTGLFFRLDDYFPTDNNINFKTGLRLDFRVDLWEFLYPIVCVEAGYDYDNGLFWGAKIDVIVLVGVAIYSFLESTMEEIPNEY